MAIIDDIKNSISNLPSQLELPATEDNPTQWEAEKDKWGKFLNNRTFATVDDLLNVFKTSTTYLLNNSFSSLDNLSTEDLNTLYGSENQGIRLQELTSNATLARNYPVNQAGTLLIFSKLPNYTLQIYSSYLGDSVYFRTNSIVTPSDWNTWKKVVSNIDIVDNLNSSSQTQVLSANQGKILNDTKFNSTGGTISGSIIVTGQNEVQGSIIMGSNLKFQSENVLSYEDSNTTLVLGNNTVQNIKFRGINKPLFSSIVSSVEVIDPIVVESDLDEITENIEDLEIKQNPLKYINNNTNMLPVVADNPLVLNLNSTDYTWSIDSLSSLEQSPLTSIINSNKLMEKTNNKSLNRFRISLEINFDTALSNLETVTLSLINSNIETIDSIKIIKKNTTFQNIIFEFDTITNSRTTTGYTLSLVSSVAIPRVKINNVIRY